MHIKLGDSVKIISGSEKNKTGEIVKIYTNSGKIVVKGINLRFKHIKPTKKNETGEKKQFEAAIHHF